MTLWRQQVGMGEEHSELSTVNEESGHIVGEEHHARCAHSDEEAGSFVLHVSSDMNEKEKDDEEAGETAAETKKRMKRQQDIQRILEYFKGVKNIPGIKSAKKKVLITEMQIEKRGNHHVSKRDCQCFWRIPQKTLRRP